MDSCIYLHLNKEPPKNLLSSIYFDKKVFRKRSCFMSEKISNYIFHLKVYVHIFSPMWNEMLTTLVSHLALFFQKSKPSMQLLLMLKTRSKRPKLKTDLSLRIRGVCQDSTLTHEIFDNYYFGSKRLEKHCNPTSNWVYDAQWHYLYWQLALPHRSKGCKVGRIWTF